MLNERRVLSGDKKAGVTVMTPITDSRSGSSGRPRIKTTSYEVDAVRNPTNLFRKINSGNWEGALEAVHANPTDASVWISRRNADDDGVAWKYLPLHLICLQQRPPLELLLALLRLYPQAATLSTPHDGNLAIHYVCESGCEDEHVFGALLASFPQSLEVKNNQDKTPLLMCNAKSRGILMKVLRQRKPLPFNENGQELQQQQPQQQQSQEQQHQPKQQPQQNSRDKDGKSRRKSGPAERRSDIDTSCRERDRRQRSSSNLRPPQTTPARYSKYHRHTFVDTDGDPNASRTPRENDRKTPRSSKNRSSRKRQQEKTKTKDAYSPFFSSSSSGDGEEDKDAAAYISSKATELSAQTTEMARSALSFLYPSYQADQEEGPAPPPAQQQQQQQQEQPQQQRERAESSTSLLKEQVRSLTKENATHQQTISNLTKNLEHLSASTESNAENSKLCERILAKAEADNVAFRTQIQRLEDEREEWKKAAEMKERANKKCFDLMRRVLQERGSKMKIDVFGSGGIPSGSSSGSCSGNDGDNDDRDQIPEALRTVLSHMDERNTKLHSANARLEADQSKLEVNLKMVRSKNSILIGERDSMTKSLREAERKATLLEEEKDMVQKGVGDLKDRVSTLTVINRSLQEQVDSMSNSTVKQENEKYQSELARLNSELVLMKEEKENTAQLQYDHQRAVEMEEKLGVLSEKNRSLKDTILFNNEKYSLKVQELGEKYSSLEKANEDLRQNIAKISSPMGGDVRMHLEGENKLLYEV